MPSALAKKFATYIGDNLPPEVQAPDAIELGNALLAAEASNETLLKAAQEARTLIDKAMGDTDPQDAEHPLLKACQTLDAAIRFS